MQEGIVIWITGLPNAGKTTISKHVENELEKMGSLVERIDSDEVPKSLTKELSSDWKKRQQKKSTNLIYVAQLLCKHNVIVLISSVGRLKEMRDIARKSINNFVEVYLKYSLETRLQRDILEKYKRYPSTIYYYEEPDKPEIVINTHQVSTTDAAQKIIHFLKNQGYLH
ncbi:adenylyl-sulfate kinase [Pseudalkalibacillus caeni]|uniref:adenylyl-sulfate kinase n=1 Tax=Exobacillus caeni TaxID=2574798 RepID=UPI0014852455|nr:adenylyl-sulfate kinase [Pseudalkalibacillus caeni]